MKGKLRNRHRNRGIRMAHKDTSCCWVPSGVETLFEPQVCRQSAPKGRWKCLTYFVQKTIAVANRRWRTGLSHQLPRREVRGLLHARGRPRLEPISLIPRLQVAMTHQGSLLPKGPCGMVNSECRAPGKTPKKSLSKLESKLGKHSVRHLF